MTQRPQLRNRANVTLSGHADRNEEQRPARRQRVVTLSDSSFSTTGGARHQLWRPLGVRATRISPTKRATGLNAFTARPISPRAAGRTATNASILRSSRWRVLLPHDMSRTARAADRGECFVDAEGNYWCPHGPTHPPNRPLLPAIRYRRSERGQGIGHFFRSSRPGRGRAVRNRLRARARPGGFEFSRSGVPSSGAPSRGSSRARPSLRSERSSRSLLEDSWRHRRSRSSRAPSPAPL